MKTKRIQPRTLEPCMWRLIELANTYLKTGVQPKGLKEHIKEWKRIRYVKNLKKGLPPFYKLYKVFNAQMELMKASKDLFPPSGRPRLAIGTLPAMVNIHEGNIDLDQVPPPYSTR